jgi:hypothetical protein
VPGPTGPSALWNFTSAYNGGASYAVGDLATYGGETWYRIHANGGNSGDTPVEGTFWTMIASSGDVGPTGPTGPTGGAVPASSVGLPGDMADMLAVGGGYLYVCVADYTVGGIDIWTKTTLTGGTW